jgi:hypothetical protein
MISPGEKWGSRRRMNRVIDQKVELSFGVLHSQILKSNLWQRMIKKKRWEWLDKQLLLLLAWVRQCAPLNVGNSLLTDIHCLSYLSLQREPKWKLVTSKVQQGGDAKLLILNLAYEIFIEKLFARPNWIENFIKRQFTDAAVYSGPQKATLTR